MRDFAGVEGVFLEFSYLLLILSYLITIWGFVSQ